MYVKFQITTYVSIQSKQIYICSAVYKHTHSHPFKCFFVSAQLSTIISSNRTHTQCASIVLVYASSKFKALAPKLNTQECRKARVIFFFFRYLP